MKHLFRQTGPGRTGYSALIVFALAYLAVLALVVAPDQVRTALDSALGGTAAPW